jgi:hypothetical protein
MKVPPGYKVVPIEPTPAMLDAAKAINTEHWQDDPTWSLADVYRAMVNAAPSDGAPASSGETKPSSCPIEPVKEKT